MSPSSLFAVQFTLSLLLSAVVAGWYIGPALRKLPLHAALVPLFLFEALRYLPSSAFAPGQVGDAVPKAAMAGIAYGDLASAVLSLCSQVTGPTAGISVMQALAIRPQASRLSTPSIS